MSKPMSGKSSKIYLRFYAECGKCAMRFFGNDVLAQAYDHKCPPKPSELKREKRRRK